MTPSLLEPTLLSLQVAAGGTLLVLPLAITFAWMLSKSQLPARSLLSALVNLPLVLPPVVSGYILLHLFGPQGPLGELLATAGVELIFTRGAAVLAGAVVALPLAVWTIKSAMDGVDPRLEDAARCLGKTEWQVFKRVTLPLSRSGLLAGGVLAFARCLGEFGATIVVAGMTPGETLTIPGAIYLYMQQPGQETRIRLLVALSVALSLGSLLLVQALQRPTPGKQP